VPEVDKPEEVLSKPEPNSTLFVKNLNFDTSDVALREHFAKIGQIYSATVATKKDLKRQGQIKKKFVAIAGQKRFINVFLLLLPMTLFLK
jgi:RNA recognition motif-containing protein